MAESPTSRPGFQFSLSALLIAVTVIAVGLTLRDVTVSHAALVAGGIVLTVGMHVAGNKLGTHLRDHSPLRHGDGPPTHVLPLQSQPVPTPAHPSKELHARRISLGTVFPATAAGALGGGFLGGLILQHWLRFGWAGWLLGVASSAVIGGILTFLAISCLVMTYRAWEEAVREHDRR